MEDTTENNKMIAEFVGGKVQGQFITWPGDKDISCLDTDLRYHKSWDALMPVVEKIEAMGYDFSISEKNAFIIATDNDSDFMPIENIKETKIDSTLSTVIQFIKWYNLKQ